MVPEFFSGSLACSSSTLGAVTLVNQALHRRLHDSDDQTHTTGFSGAFWAVNGLVVCVLVLVCGWVCCCGGLDRLIEWTRDTAESSDLMYQRRLRERLERQEASKRMTPEQRKRKILESFQRNQVKMIVTASDIVVEEPEPPHTQSKDLGPPRLQQQQPPTEDDNSQPHPAGDVDIEQGVVLPLSTREKDATTTQATEEEEQQQVDDDYEAHLQNNGYLILRHVSLSQNKNEQQQQEQSRKVPNCCAICLMSYEPDDSVVWSSNPDCPHVFHEDCLLDWLVVHSSRNNNSGSSTSSTSTPCPCCRQSFTDLRNFRRERTIRWDPENAFNPRVVTFG